MSEFKPIVLLVHGFATGPDDLKQLRLAFNEAGVHTKTITLLGHDKRFKDLPKQDFKRWLAQVRGDVKRLRARGYTHIGFVGFSLGGLLGLHLAEKGDIDGLLAISTFLGPKYKRSARLILSISKMFKSSGIRRWKIQTTVPLKRVKPNHPDHHAGQGAKLPHEPMRSILRSAEAFSERNPALKCPVLIVQSADDPVSGYVKVADLIRGREDVDALLITLHGLKHFVQYDIDPGLLCSLAIMRFFADQIDTEDLEEESALRRDPIQMHDVADGPATRREEEARHWSGIIFQTIAGFFVVFGSLLMFTAADVLDPETRELRAVPYYLLLYSFVINIYIHLSVLYFYYLNRNDAYTRNHIEPYMSGTEFVNYRTSGTISGTMSKKMTEGVSIMISTLPLLTSILMVAILPFLFPDRFNLSLEADNLVLTIGWLLAATFCFTGLRACLIVVKHSHLHLYTIPVQRITSPLQGEFISRLYDSASPGGYRNRYRPAEITIDEPCSEEV
jgi:esterase/lipase